VATDPEQMTENPAPGEAEKTPPVTEAAVPTEDEAAAPTEGEAATPAPSDAAVPPKKGRKTAQEQAQARREAKLDAVSEQIEKGGLVIRQMTVEERLKYPPRPTPVKRPGPRSR
jgi:hypothetical protein